MRWFSKPKKVKTKCVRCGNTFEHSEKKAPPVMKDGPICPTCYQVVEHFLNKYYTKGPKPPRISDYSIKEMNESIKEINETAKREAVTPSSVSEGVICHAKGLPVSESERVSTYLDKDALIFNSIGNFRAKLPYNRIISVSYDSAVVTSESRRENYPAMQAALGGILFGPTGAIVGAVSKGRKETKWTSGYTIDIFYTDAQGQQKHIVLFETLTMDRPLNDDWGYTPLFVQNLRNKVTRRLNPQQTITL